MPKSKRTAPWRPAPKQPIEIKGGVISAPAPNELRYYATLSNMIEYMAREVERDIRALFADEAAQEYFAQDASISAQARILTNKLMARFNKSFADRAKGVAERFVREGDKANQVTVQASLRELSGNLVLPRDRFDAGTLDIMSATVTQNVGLIKSISSEYLTDVQGAVMRSITTGNGLQDLVPWLQKQKGITLRRARFIAMDQNRKLSNDLTAARNQSLGLTSYIWRHTSGSDEPRKLHESYDGRTFRYDDPPVIDERTGERGIPGQAPGCKCRQQMVLVFKD